MCWLQPVAVIQPNNKLEQTQPTNQTEYRVGASSKEELERVQPTEPPSKHTVYPDPWLGRVSACLRGLACGAAGLGCFN